MAPRAASNSRPTSASTAAPACSSEVGSGVAWGATGAGAAVVMASSWCGADNHEASDPGLTTSAARPPGPDPPADRLLWVVAALPAGPDRCPQMPGQRGERVVEPGDDVAQPHGDRLARAVGVV